jgi:hypothetical protein
MSRRALGCVFAAILLLAAAPAFSQEQTRLTGMVTDSQGAILPGVSVTASSPALIGGRSAITEGDGRFMFPSLSPGLYELTFQLSGFQTVKRGNIQLTLAKTLAVDVQLQIASLQTSVTVTAESPVVDTQSTKIGNDFTGEKLVGIPSGTDIWAALGQAPGVRMGGFDVGGSHKASQPSYETFGVGSQNRIVTDGVDTTEGANGAGFYQDYFIQDEISISGAGGDVTMNTPGAGVFSTIKSGGNRFRSLENFAYEPGKFVGNNVDTATAARGYTGQPNLLFWEAHGDLGGPIKKDRIWFYTAVNKFKINKAVSGQDPKVVTNLGISRNVTGKVTFKATEKDTLNAYYQWEFKDMPYRGLSANTGKDSILAQHSPTHMWSIVERRVWTNRLFSELRAGSFGYDWPMVPAVDWHTNPPRRDTGTTVDSGAGWNAANAQGPYELLREKPQVFFTTTYYLPTAVGSHDIKAGFEWLNDRSQSGSNGQSGPIFYLDKNGKVDQVQLTDLGAASEFGKSWTGGENRNTRYALFLQDRWSPARGLTITAGVRFDHQRPNYLSSVRNPLLTDIFQPATTPSGTLTVSNGAAPRLGASWDLSGEGKMVAKVFFGRYYFNFADGLGSASPGGENWKRYTFNDLNGNRIYDGPQELGALVSTYGGSTTKVDPNIQTPYTDEISASFERQFWGQASVRVAYVRKMSRKQYNTRNVLLNGQFTVPYAATVNLVEYNGTSSGNIVGSQTFTVYDIPASLKGQVSNVIATAPGLDTNYDTLQFSFEKRFRTGLFLQASFDHTWRDELRSNSGGTGTDSNPIGTSFFYNVNPAVSNRQKTTTWQARMIGRYSFGYGVGLAANFLMNSGWTYSRLIQVTLPNAAAQTFFLDDFKGHRSPSVALLSLRADKAFTFGWIKVTVMADAFNVLNKNTPVNFGVLNGANYNKIYGALDPRTFQLGLRLEF